MKRIDTDLAGVWVIEPQVFGDPRGFFLESYHQDKFARLGMNPQFVQTNVSRSAHGVLRGLHYQWGQPQGKLVAVLEGAVWDVAVDIRRNSPQFGRWIGVELSAENHHLLWIPEGFAHGFCVLSEFATFMYQCTTLYDPDTDAGIRWNDPDLAITWPIADPLLSAKDSQTPLLADVAMDRLPYIRR